jgi:hypothetical protein
MQFHEAIIGVQRGAIEVFGVLYAISIRVLGQKCFKKRMDIV